MEMYNVKMIAYQIKCTTAEVDGLRNVISDEDMVGWC